MRTVRLAPLLALALLATPAPAQTPVRLAIDGVRVLGGSRHVLLVRAQDSTGAPVEGLESGFRAGIDGGEVRDLAARSPFGGHEPATVAIVVDGEMLAPSSDDRRLVLALLPAVAGALDPADRVVVVSAGPSLRHFERSAAQVRDGQESFESLAQQGEPRLLDALAQAAEIASRHRVLSSGLVVAITRGSTGGSRARPEDVVARAHAPGGQTSIVVALRGDAGESTLDELAGPTQGAVLRVRGAPGDAERLASAVRSLRMRYELTFRPRSWDAHAASHRVEVGLASGAGPLATREYQLADVAEGGWWASPVTWVLIVAVLVVAALVFWWLQPRQLALLVVQGGEDDGVWYEIFSLPLTIGSGDDDDIVLPAAGVSRNHCLLQLQGRQFVLVDTHSEGGTWVQGERIRKRALQDEDVIRLGPTTELVFEDHR